MQQDNLFSDTLSFDETNPLPDLVDSSSVNTQWLEQHFALQADSDLPDGLARFQGVHPHHSFIVQAPAGSGKTSLLAQRFLALLSQVESPEQIVAMTFTKKAAAEMRERIVEALMLGEKALPTDASLVETNTWKLAQKALQRNKDQAWSLLKNPNRLRIKTIDGLNSYLVGQMPLLSKMGGQSQLLQDATPAYQEAVRQVLKMPELEEQVGRLLRLVNGRFNRAESLLIGMLAKRDQWMRTLIQYQGDEAREVLEAAIEEIVSKTLSEQLKGLYYLKEAFQEACSIAEYAVENDQPQLAALCGAWPIAEDSSEVEKWRVLADWLLTGKDEIRKTVNIKNGFPAGKGEAKEQKDRFLEVLKQIRVAAANHSEILPGLVTLKTLPNPDYSDEQWQDLQWLIQLLTLSTGFLKLVFQQTGQSDYIEIAQAASQALGSELEPTDLAQQLDYQIQHLLVDEFQDTSSEQYKLLKQLIAGWQPDDGRTLFLVGDPMQSIYRFREAEVGNFLEAWKGKIGTVELNQLNLKVNFRSTAGVVNWVNQVFAQILPKEDVKEKGAVSYSDSIAFSNNENHAVTTHWALNQTAHEEALQILEVIQKRLAEFAQQDAENASLEKPAKPSKIAILGRSRSSLMGIAQLLKQHQIGFRAVDLENLAERQEVQDVLALSRSLLHLADRAAWIALLRSPLVGLNLKDIYAVIGDKPFQTAWYAIERFRCKDGKKSNHQAWCFSDLENLSEVGLLRLEKSMPIIDNALKRLGSLAFSTLIRETWLQLDGPQTVENALALENVDVFCQTLASSDGELLDIKQLEKQMETLFARPDSAPESQRIELMTMHKSKGLEFDTVILPGLGKKPRGDDAELVSWFQFLGESGEEQLVIAPIDQKGQKTSSLRTLLKSFEAEKQRYELGRLLYVAATRAKQQLHLFAQVKYQPTEKNIEKGDYTITPTKESLLESLWSYAQKEFEQLANGYNPPDRQEQEVDIPWPKVSRLPIERKGFSKFKVEPLFIATQTTKSQQASLPNELIEQDMADDKSAGLVFNQQNALLNTTVGNLVHAVFEQMVIDGMEQWDQAKLTKMLPGYELWLLQNGLPEKDLPEAMRRVKKSINHALNNAKVCWALQSNLPESATEYPLSSIEGDTVANHIVDRTFIDDEGVRWIVDYKTSVNDDEKVDTFIAYQTEKYQSQLERYGQLFAQIEQRPQKWVLYFSYLDVWHELN
ncbi:UvrD-helicase domain-containing protein [Thiomicrorhabdus lithotrophica]|uniref:DNA 3'-5' helicase n=1 Tax=Thiomicrorhabdus lithotrophica TaxID=2949997 RepID=A0ABY8C953_9GAMM|nr:UvrD-helicase domain-containing protein [Thiomicrorhabdus lithotrophica]WEJ62067.1 UvrD-helicase domain-containing protein [Thiomicrorhabdus lithotrophica]